jgi:hypothetical protein
MCLFDLENRYLELIFSRFWISFLFKNEIIFYFLIMVTTKKGRTIFPLSSVTGTVVVSGMDMNLNPG